MHISKCHVVLVFYYLRCGNSANSPFHFQSCSDCPNILHTWRARSSLKRSCSSNAGGSRNTVLCLVLLYRPLWEQRGNVYMHKKIYNIRIITWSLAYADILPVPLNIAVSSPEPSTSGAKEGTAFLLTRCLKQTHRLRDTKMTQPQIICIIPIKWSPIM